MSLCGRRPIGVEGLQNRIKKASAYGVSGRRWQGAGCRYAPSSSVHPCTVLHLLSVSSRDFLMLGRPPSKGKKMAALKGIRVRGSARNWSQGQLDTTVLLSTCIGVVICDWTQLTVTDSDEAHVFEPLSAQILANTGCTPHRQRLIVGF